MHVNANFFTYIYSTMPGTKKLCIPSISSNYKWNGPEVLSLCSQGALYIMAQRLPLLLPQEEAHDDWSIVSTIPCRIDAIRHVLHRHIWLYTQLSDCSQIVQYIKFQSYMFAIIKSTV